MLFICCCLNGMYFNYAFLFTYHISFIKQFHIEYPIYLIYSVVVSFNLGLIFTSYCFLPSMNFFRFPNMLRIYALAVFASMCLFAYFSHIIWLYFMYFCLGICHQLMVMNLIFILNVKFKRHLVTYTAIVFTGSSICLVWGYVFTLIMNPSNAPKKMSFTLADGVVENYFDWSVGRNFPVMCMTYGTVNLLAVFLISFFVQIPEKLYAAEEQSARNSLEYRNLSFYSKAIFDIIRVKPLECKTRSSGLPEITEKVSTGLLLVILSLRIASKCRKKANHCTRAGKSKLN